MSQASKGTARSDLLCKLVVLRARKCSAPARMAIGALGRECIALQLHNHARGYHKQITFIAENVDWYE
jgi:hypothetical protein